MRCNYMASLRHKRSHFIGVVAEFRAGSEFPLSRTGLSYALNLGSAEGIEAVHQCDADLDFGGLTIGIA